MRSFAIIAAASLALVPGLVKAAEPPCLTSAEFSSLMTYALPSVIEGTSQRCASALPADSYLRAEGGQLAERYSTRKQESWPAAKAAFLKLSSTTDRRANALMREMPEEGLQTMLDVVLAGMASQEIPLDECPTIDRFAQLLAPLPPENTAELLTLTIRLASDKETLQMGMLRVCPDEAL